MKLPSLRKFTLNILFLYNILINSIRTILRHYVIPLEKKYAPGDHNFNLKSCRSIGLSRKCRNALLNIIYQFNVPLNSQNSIYQSRLFTERCIPPFLCAHLRIRKKKVQGSFMLYVCILPTF